MKPDISKDEFICDRCGEVWDIEDSARIGKDELFCPDCLELRESLPIDPDERDRQ